MLPSRTLGWYYVCVTKTSVSGASRDCIHDSWLSLFDFNCKELHPSFMSTSPRMRTIFKIYLFANDVFGYSLGIRLILTLWRASWIIWGASLAKFRPVRGLDSCNDRSCAERRRGTSRKVLTTQRLKLLLHKRGPRTPCVSNITPPDVEGGVVCAPRTVNSVSKQLCEWSHVRARWWCPHQTLSMLFCINKTKAAFNLYS